MKQISLKTLFFILWAYLVFPKLSHAHFGSKGPFGGTVSVIISHDSVVYIGTAKGGVYQSVNSRLQQWVARPVGLKSGAITALAHTGKYLFAATADSGIFVFNGLLSDKYWMKKSKGLKTLKITSLLVIDSVSVIAATDGAGLFKTTNGGESWIEFNNPDLHHLEISTICKAGNKLIIGAPYGGFYASDDMGGSWYDFNDVNTDHVQISNLISYNEWNNEILVNTSNGLFRTSVGAANTTVAPVYTFADLGLPADADVTAITNDGVYWYLTTTKGVFRSSSTSISWSSFGTGLTGTNATAIGLFQSRIITGIAKLGIFTGTISSPNWVAANNGFNNLATYSIAANGLLIITATENGVFVSKDLAASYARSNNGLTDSLNVNDIAIAGSWLFAATKNGGVFYSADTGKTWIATNRGLETNIKRIYFNKEYKYAIAESGAIYQGLLTGGNWELIQGDLPRTVTPTSMIFLGDTIVLGTNGSGVFIKPPSLNSWTALNSGLSNLRVTSLTVQNNSIFAGTTFGSVFIANRSNFNWSAVAGAPVSSHTQLVDNSYFSNQIQDLFTAEGYVFASYRGALFATSDLGKTWIPAGNQFNLPTYTNVNKIAAAQGRIFVTTEHNSLYSNALSELPIVTGIEDELSDKFSNIRLSPNPSAGEFEIISDHDISELSVYDMQGKFVSEIGVIGNDVKVNQPQGMYLLKISIGTQNIFRKIVIE